MGLSATQQFLLGAHRAAAAEDYFRWHAVGATLGYSEAQSRAALQSLNERKLVILLTDGNARLLDAGRQLAIQLERKNGEARTTGGRR